MKLIIGMLTRYLKTGESFSKLTTKLKEVWKLILFIFHYMLMRHSREQLAIVEGLGFMDVT